MSNWTNPEHEQMLREIWPSGLSRAQMARAINAAFPDAAYSRNAVIGKGVRLGLPPTGQASAPVRIARPKPMPGAHGLKAPPVARAPGQNNGLVFRMKAAALKLAGRGTVFEEAEAREPRVAPEVTDQKPGSATIHTLSARMCRFPIGDPREPGFTFCGCRTLEGRSYCEPCHARTHQPSSPNKHATEPFQARATARFA